MVCVINFDEVLTFSEAAEKWGLADGKTIRKAVERNRFEPYEIKKSGNVWLTTYDAMLRVFGEPRISMPVLYYFELYDNEKMGEILDEFFIKAEKLLAKGHKVRIAESRNHPEKIITIIESSDELAQWKRHLQYVTIKKSNNR